MIDRAVLETALTAVTERRNRLMKLDQDNHVNQPNIPTLRSRIQECNAAIREIKESLNARP